MMTSASISNNNICPICLQEFESPALLDACFHKFCFLCINQWAQVTQTCPLCKSWFKSLIYDINKETQTYKRLYLEDVKQFRKSKKLKKLPDQSTLIQQQSRRIIYAQKLKPVINFPLSKIPFPRPSSTSPTISKRSFSYQNEENLRQSWLNKLSLWLQREIPILLSMENSEPNTNIEEEVKIVSTVVTGLVQQYGDLNLPQPKKELSEFFFDDTEQFIHELMTFLRSPYDLMTYDQKVTYVKSLPAQTGTPPSNHLDTHETRENICQNQPGCQEAMKQPPHKRPLEVIDLPNNKDDKNQSQNKRSPPTSPPPQEDSNHATKRQKTCLDQNS